MFEALAASFRHGDQSVRRRIVLAYILLAFLNLGAWALAFLAFHDASKTLSLCLLAYGLGLRHAVDADHIAAIDNVTRKLMQEGQRPVGVGFFFSLGHSTVVVIMCGVVALGTNVLETRFKEVGALIGTTVSAVFLLVIALINFVILVEVFRAFRAAKAGRVYSEDALQQLLNGRGLLARILRPLFRFVDKSWHMYPVGFLFGLGFDTTSEVALLGLAATQAGQQVSVWSIMIFPLLFTAGMCLIDTTDGVVMLGAYGWAFVRPMRKLFYNLTITLVSFLIALGIGVLEALGVLAARFGWEGGAWDYVNLVNENSGLVGYVVIGLLLASWAASVIVYRLWGLDRIDDAGGQNAGAVRSKTI
jgi:high-affinity nickel-transport protein